MHVLGIKDRKDRLQEHISQDRLLNTGGALNASEACRATRVNSSQIDEAARHLLLFVADSNIKVRHVFTAIEGIPTLLAVVLRAGHLRVVVLDDGVFDQNQCGAGIGNGTNALFLEIAAAHAVAGGRELPEAVGRINTGVADLAGMLAAIDVPEIVSTRSTFLQICGEDVVAQETLCNS